MAMERREVAESALKHMCERIGVAYTTETQPIEDAWFLDSNGRGRVTIAQWSEDAHSGGRGISHPLGSYGVNLTHEGAYDRLWFADRCFTAMIEAARYPINPDAPGEGHDLRLPAGLIARGVGEGLAGYAQ
jgi:hypothetical protein